MATSLLNSTPLRSCTCPQLVPKTNDIYDDYEIKEEVLGIGATGKIRLCIHKATHAEYALKVD